MEHGNDHELRAVNRQVDVQPAGAALEQANLENVLFLVPLIQLQLDLVAGVAQGGNDDDPLEDGGPSVVDAAVL